MKSIIITSIIAAAIVAVACGGDNNDGTATTAPATVTGDHRPRPAEIAASTPVQPEPTSTSIPRSWEQGVPPDDASVRKALGDGDEMIRSLDLGDPRCVEADAVAQGIAEGLTVSGGGSLRHAQAVRSAEFESAWFVAAEIDGQGLEGDGEIGLWVTNAIDGSGLILSVNDLAREFSSWGHSDWTDARFSLGDDGAAEAIDCVD